MAQYFENANLPSNITEFEAYFLSNKFVFKSDNGVFSKEKLDFGTRLLLESLPMQEMKGDVLDLGCGYGVVSIILSRFIDCNFDAVDVNKRALHLFEMNIKLNHVSNINFFESNAYDKIDKIRGMNIVIVTTAKNDLEARELLSLYGMPFKKS